MKRFGRSLLAGCMISGLAASVLSGRAGTILSVQAAEQSAEGVSIQLTGTEEETVTGNGLCEKSGTKKEEDSADVPVESVLEKTPEIEEDTNEPDAIADTQIPAVMSNAVDLQGQGSLKADHDAAVPQLQLTYAYADRNLDHVYGHSRSTYMILSNIGDTSITLVKITLEKGLLFSNDSTPKGTISSGVGVRTELNCYDDPPVGEYTKMMTVQYKTENGDVLTVDLPVPFKVTRCKLNRIENVDLIKRRHYDGTTRVQVRNSGTLEGLIGDDEVEISAVAEFDSKDAGRRTITVTWNISGPDSQNYYLDLSSNPHVDIDEMYITDSSVNTITYASNLDKSGHNVWIDKGIRTCTFTFPDLHIGEDPQTLGGPVWTDKEEGDDPTYMYKPQGFYDVAYKKELPQTPGVYTVRAKFPDTNNWQAYTTETDFEIFREMTGGKRNLKTGVAYQFGSGSWQVTGDSTVYRGGNDFYATDEREYEFTAK